MMNNIFRAPRGNKITLRMFISPRNQQQANPGGNANGLRDLNERNLAVDEQRTGDKRFIAREVNITGRLMSSPHPTIINRGMGLLSGSNYNCKSINSVVK